MKGLFTKITALLLIVWYSMSIIGFDVHTCSGSGKSFVVSFIEGLSCEDIHPEHRCAKENCCADEHSCCHSHQHSDGQIQISSKSCCSNDYQVLSLTGATLDNKDDEHSICSCSHCLYLALHTVDLSADAMYADRTLSHRMPDHRPGLIPDGQSLFSVWRI